MSGLDPDINLCQDLMSRSHVRISCRDQMCIFQLDFPFLLLSISQNLEFCIYDCFFGLDFPFPLLSISQYFKLCIYDCYFLGGFPVSELSISPNLKFCIHDCTFGLYAEFQILRNT